MCRSAESTVRTEYRHFGVTDSNCLVVCVPLNSIAIRGKFLFPVKGAKRAEEGHNGYSILETCRGRAMYEDYLLNL